MRTDPPSNPHPLPDFVTRPHLDALAAIRARVATKAPGTPDPTDRRVGFGIVQACGPMRRSVLTLQVWRWRGAYADAPAEGPTSGFFSDDPMGVVARTPLGMRTWLATEFAKAAGEALDGTDVTFRVHPVEIAAAGSDSPEGIRRGGDVDLMVIDLMERETAPRIVDRLLRRELELVPDDRFLGRADFFLRLRLWQRAERINAARSMLGLDLPPIRIPGVAALQRRIVQFTGSEYGYEAPVRTES